MNKFRIISLILVIALSFGMVSFSEDLSEQEIASKLYQIGLVSGDGSGLNLDGGLTRAQAATFIVKLIGREDTVLGSPSFYGMTPFTDIKGDEWYAPFVGYCAMNKIISGYPDNTFRAEEKLTEKAFLSMILKSLQYTGDDYTWDNVFLTAYNKGIVKDLSYAVKVEDVDLDRGATLELMYNALNLYYKDNSKTLLDNLITNGVVSQSKAESLSLVKKDTTKTAIVKAEAIALKEIKVTLNEEISGMTVNQVAVSAGGVNYSVNDVTLNGNTITVKVDTNLTGNSFNITLVNIIDKENFVVKSTSASVSPFQAPEVTSDYFKVKKVVGESKNIVHVFFTQPININASLVLHYEILQGTQVVATGTYNDMEAAVLGEVDNGVALYVKSIDFQQGIPYVLKVKGSLTSAYDANLNEGKEMQVDFIGNGSSNQTLSVDTIDAISTDTVRVVFNQDIDKSIATNITNYSFRNASNNSNSAVLSASMNETGPLKNRTLDLRVLDMYTNNAYELKILNARDAFKSSTITNGTYSVVKNNTTTSKVKLEYVQPVSSTKLYFYFDKPIHPASVAANITGINDVLALYSEQYNNRLVVYLDKNNPIKQGSSYSVQISSGLIEANGQTQSLPTSYTISGIDSIEPDIQIEDARFVADNKVKVQFNTEVAASNAASQYKLQYKNDLGHDVSITADSINYVDGKTAILSYSNLPSETYKIVMYNIVDPSNQFTTQLITADVTKE